MKIKDLEIINSSQHLFDSFNDFILSADTKVFGKLLARCLLLNQVKDIPGDIVECGVFKGTGLMTFLKAKKFLCPNGHKKVIGFDFFNSSDLLKTLQDIDREAMATLFEGRNYEHKNKHEEILAEYILNCGFAEHEFELVAGDITQTSHEYVKDKPGFRISLLYIDLDLDVPSYETLNALWDKVSKGGIVVFDEYAFHKWSEANGVDRFFKDKNITIKTLNYICPTAYTIKQ